jgi:hypothetical protein
VHACEAALVDVAGDGLEVELARVNVVSALGDLAGPAAFVAVGAAGGSWRLVLALGAVAMAAYAAWLATTPFPPPAAGRHGDGDGSVDAAGAPWREAVGLVRDGRVWLLAVVSALFGSLDEAYYGAVVGFLQEERALTPSAATAGASGMVVGGLLAYGVLARRPPGPRALRGAAVAMTAGAAAIAAVPHVAAVAAAATAFGAAFGVFWVAFQAAVLRHRPDRAASVATVVGVLEHPGLAVPVAVGALADAAGLHAAVLAYVAVPALLVPLVARLGHPR